MRGRRLLRRFGENRSGNIALTFCIALPVMIGATTFATDMGNLYLQRRSLQGTADAAALAAAGQPSKGQALVRRILDENGHKAASFALSFGAYKVDASGARRFTPQADGPIARVEAASDIELHFAGIFGLTKQSVAAKSDAARMPVVSLSAGSRLAAAEPTVLNPLFEKLLGFKVDLKVADYNALLTSSLPLKPLLSALAQTMGESPVDAILGNVLTKPLKISVVLDLLSRQMDAKGDSPAGAALRKMALQLKSSSATVTLSEALALDPALLQSSLGHASARLASSISVLGLVDALLGQNRVDATIKADVGVPGLASQKVELMIGEALKKTRSMAVSDGLPKIATDQIRMRLTTQVGLLGLGEVKLPLELVVAGGTAEVVSVTCSDKAWEREVKVAIRPGLARLSLGDTDRRPLAQAHVNDRLSPVMIASLLGVEGVANAVIAATPKTVTFRGNEIGSGATKSVDTKSLVSGLFSTVLKETDFKMLGLSAGPILATVEPLLMTLAKPIDEILNSVLATAGVRVGELDVRVDDLACQQARIVG
ncbi:pilus assembly protein TadG-related protein [Aureimonas sp. AU40]|uniref:pilus assembly protein TadG-related protein n=1 Tax=Aureimonas sp. AU40 TaxID=1637747 RepID=UPI000785F42F|nr:pilus assembly protein TadG-related protein [Aureimonas sp. AU40]